MDLDLLKGLLMAVMLIVSFGFGLIPLKVHRHFVATNDNELFQGKVQLFISLVTCFAGGVFLGVCLLDVLPDALDSWEAVKSSLDYNGGYPFVPLMVGCGLLLVWLFEEATDKCQEMMKNVGRSDSTLSSTDSEANVFRDRKCTIISQIPDPPQKRETSIARSITFVAAFVFHSTLEGFAFGIQKDTVSISSLFAGIIIHKAVVFFSIGVRLTRAHPTRPMVVTIMIAIVGITAPVGGIVGIVVENSHIDHTAKDIVMLILSCMSLGTFLYITFFELIGPEKANHFSGTLQWIATSGGFFLIAMIMIWSS